MRALARRPLDAGDDQGLNRPFLRHQLQTKPLTDSVEERRTIALLQPGAFAR
jgi:hypothetical protein